MTAWGDVVEAVTPSYGPGSVSAATGHLRPGTAGHLDLAVVSSQSYELVGAPVGRSNGVWPSAGKVLPHLTTILGV